VKLTLGEKTVEKIQNARFLTFVAILGMLITGLQSILILFADSEICSLDGCNTVEKLQNLPPIVFNIVGFFFFVSIIALIQLRTISGNRVLRAMSISSVAAEGFLVGYQIYVAHAYCAYCLVVCALFVSLALISWKNSLEAVFGVFLALICIMGTVTYSLETKAVRISDLEFGVRAIQNPEKMTKQQVFFIFSENCGHCQNMLKKMHQITETSINYNPIAQLSNDAIYDSLSATRTSGDTTINRRFINDAGAGVVPVLVVVDGFSYRLITGSAGISEWIETQIDESEVVTPITTQKKKHSTEIESSTQTLIESTAVDSSIWMPMTDTVGTVDGCFESSQLCQ
jgi:uncharacterized membrane protein